MATWIETADDSDLTPSWPSASVFDKDMIEGASGAGNFTFSIPASATRSAAFITIAGVPNNNAFEDGGTFTVEIDMNCGDADVDARCRCVRLDASGNILGVKGAFTGFQTMAADRTFSPVAPTWTGVESCSDRFAIEWEFVENAGMTANVKINIRVTTSEIITDISTDVGACVGGGFVHSQVVTVG